METTKPVRKYYILTYGCQMNKNDSERIAGLLSGFGFVETGVEEEADLILMNTCSVRQSAEDRIYGKMEDFMQLKEKRPEVLVAITGCLPGRDKTGELRKRLRAADLFFPTPQMVKLPQWIAELRPEWVTTGDVEGDYLKIAPLRAPSAQAYVTIQTGCNKFCTYCVVPYARGMERNRPLADILAELRNLAERGVVEVTLLGQTVNSYRATDPEMYSSENPYKDHFAALLWEANQIPGIERIHWTAPHPNSMSDEVIDALTLPKQVAYLHLPVQAGSTDVLFRMNRKYTRESFLDVIRKVKAKCPSIALGTDIIVGFCGETDAQFQDTVSLYKECDFDISYTAMYSQRSGTLGAKLYADDVLKEEKKHRWQTLQALMEETTLRKNQTFVGQTVSVLVDRIENGYASGNSFQMKLVRFPVTSDTGVGKIVSVRINQAYEWQLIGARV